MSKFIEQEKELLKYMRTSLENLIIGERNISNARYHHNCSYSDVSSICRYGILTLQDLNDKKIKLLDPKLLKIMDDIDSHVNGIKNVSLAVVGLDDLNIGEDEYNPYWSCQVDLLITSDIKARRSSTHYGNEFLSKSIETDKIYSVDIRLLKLIKETEKSLLDGKNNIGQVVDYYNKLKDIAEAIKETGFNAPLREMSNDGNCLIDINQLAKIKKIRTK